MRSHSFPGSKAPLLDAAGSALAGVARTAADGSVQPAARADRRNPVLLALMDSLFLRALMWPRQLRRPLFRAGGFPSLRARELAAHAA